MLHEIGDLELERSRISERAELSSAPPILAHFDLTVEGSAAAYAARLRGALSAVLALAMSQGFEGEDIPVDTVPEWFTGVCRGADGPAVDFARNGTERYFEATVSGPWELQDWLYRFDPDMDVRGWAWWDLTALPDGRLRLWADTWGEPFFSWEDLRWLLYTCGARVVEGPVLVQPEVWAREVSA